MIFQKCISKFFRSFSTEKKTLDVSLGDRDSTVTFINREWEFFTTPVVVLLY